MGAYGSPDLSNNVGNNTKKENIGNKNTSQLKKCRRCGTEYLKTWDRCPKCRQKNNKGLGGCFKIIKNTILGIVGFIILMFILSSFISKGTGSPKNTGISSVEQGSKGINVSKGTKENPYSIGEKGKFATISTSVITGDKLSNKTNQEVTINSIRYSDKLNNKLREILGSKYTTDLNNGYKYAVLNITVANLNNDQGIKMYSNYFKYVEGGKVAIENDSIANSYDIEGVKKLDGVVIYKNGEYNGDVIIKVKDGDRNPMLIYGNNVAWFSLIQK